MREVSPHARGTREARITKLRAGAHLFFLCCELLGRTLKCLEGAIPLLLTLPEPLDNSRLVPERLWRLPRPPLADDSDGLQLQTRLK